MRTLCRDAWEPCAVVSRISCQDYSLTPVELCDHAERNYAVTPLVQRPCEERLQNVYTLANRYTFGLSRFRSHTEQVVEEVADLLSSRILRNYTGGNIFEFSSRFLRKSSLQYSFWGYIGKGPPQIRKTSKRLEPLVPLFPRLLRYSRD